MLRQAISGKRLLDFNLFPPLDQSLVGCGFVHHEEGYLVRSSVEMGSDDGSNRRGMCRSTHGHVALLFPHEESTPLCSQKVGCVLK